MVDPAEVSLSVTLAPGGKGDPLVLASPVIAASGTFGTGVELRGVVDFSRLGAIVTTGIARATRPARGPTGAGRRAVLAESPAGLLLAERYATVGLNRVLRGPARSWGALGTAVIANVPGEDEDECLAIAAALVAVESLAGLEVDFTSPPLRDSDTAAAVLAVRRLTERLRAAWPLALIAKLPYAGPASARLAVAARAGGADAVAFGGGFPAAGGYGVGGGRGDLVSSGRLVGPATRPLALRAIAEAAPAAGLSVIASGGIVTAEDAVGFLLAGATAVQVGSATLADPRAAVTVADGIASHLAGLGERDVRNLIGAGRRPVED